MMGMNKEQRRAWAPLVKEARKAAGLDQEELAQRAGTTRRTVGSIERGDSVPQRDVLLRILGVLGLNPNAEDADPDVEAFVAMLRPLLQRLGAEDRARLMPEIVTLVADALKASPRSNVVAFSPKPSVGDPNVAHLYDEPSAAHPEPRNDVEGDEEPEGP